MRLIIYIKNILLPLKHLTWDKLHCCFCLEIAKDLLCFAFEDLPIILQTLVSFKYSTTNIFNPNVRKYYMKKYSIPDFDFSEYWGSE
jgi:hypothetical protein